MKSVILLLFFSLSTVLSSVAQNQSKSESGSVDFEELPEVVLKRVGEDFSIYLPDRNPDANVRGLQQFFVAYDLGKDYEGYENYLVIMENEKGKLTATYNDKGKLIRVLEKYEDVRLPNDVIYAILKAFPGWGIVNDKYVYAQADGKISKKHYKVKIQNGSQTKRLTVTPTGEILN